MRPILLTLALVLATAPAFADLTAPDTRTAPRAEGEQALPDAHPSAYFHYAERLYAEDDREQAITWMYVGRIRYLLHLHSNPAGGDEATEEFRKLTSAVLFPAMQWASDDIDMLIDPFRGLTDEERIIAVIIQIAAYILSLFFCIVICVLT